MKTYYVYIMASERFGTLYIGVTSDIYKRVWEHKSGALTGFSKKYRVHKLVYFEETNDVNAALQREKSLKRWYRDWKIELINKFNPEWNDLAEDLNFDGSSAHSPWRSLFHILCSRADADGVARRPRMTL